MATTVTREDITSFSELNARYYAGVGSLLKERLLTFRRNCPATAMKVKDQDWEYYSIGQANRTLVLLPGGLGIAEAWFDCMLEWQNKYKVIAISYPAVESVAEIIAAIQAILKREGAAEVGLVGTSLGGYVAQALIRENPNMLTHAIFGNTGIATTEYRRKLDKQIAITKLFKNRLAFRVIKFAAKKKISQLFSLLNGEDRTFWNAYMADVIDNQYSPDTMRTQFRISLDFATHFCWDGETAPLGQERILIIEAEDDDAFPKERKEGLKKLFPQAQVKTFDRGGHLLLMTRRDEYIKTIDDFLKS